MTTRNFRPIGIAPRKPRRGLNPSVIAFFREFGLRDDLDDTQEEAIAEMADRFRAEWSEAKFRGPVRETVFHRETVSGDLLAQDAPKALVASAKPDLPTGDAWARVVAQLNARVQ